MSEEELIETLKAFEKNRVEQLPESASNLFYAIMKIADERDRLNNIINELEKEFDDVIKDPLIHMCYKRLARRYADKLQELKGSDKE